jgi:uncharacterized membrane protein
VLLLLLLVGCWLLLLLLFVVCCLLFVVVVVVIVVVPCVYGIVSQGLQALPPTGMWLGTRARKEKKTEEERYINV